MICIFQAAAIQERHPVPSSDSPVCFDTGVKIEDSHPVTPSDNEVRDRNLHTPAPALASPESVTTPCSTTSVKRGSKIKRHDAKNIMRRQHYADLKAGKVQRKAVGRPKKAQTKHSKSEIQYRDRYRAEKSFVRSVQKLQGAQHSMADAAMLVAAQTKSGSKVYPAIASTVAKALEGEVSTKCLQKLAKTASRKHKRSLVVMCCSDGLMTPQQYRSLSGEALAYIRKSIREPPDSISWQEEQYASNVTRDKVRGDRQIIWDFFHENTSVSSGASRPTRELRMQKHVLNFRWYAAYPAYLRKYAADNPSVVASIQKKMSVASNSTPKNGKTLRKKLTRFEASLLAAVHQSQGACSSKYQQEYNSRYAKAQARYMMTLENTRLRREGKLPPYPDQPDPQNTSYLAFDPATYNPTPVSETTLWKVIGEMKIRWTRNINPHPCPHHDEGPSAAVLLQQVIEEKGRLEAVIALGPSNDKHGDRRANLKRLEILKSQKTKLERKVASYEKHMLQYEACRPYVKSIEENLKVGECLVYRDFVNQHTGTGNKMNNLVLVVRWREHEDEPLRTRKINNFCHDAETNSCDVYFVHDVFDFHLKPASSTSSGLFEKFSKIYISGDHGPHFAGKSTLFNESRMKKRYGKEIHIVSLCSYHAYNRCDAAGVESKRLAKLLGIDDKAPETSEEYANMVVESNYHNSYAYPFRQINRSQNVFPQNLIKGDGLELAGQCEVIFQTSDVPATEGIIMCKMIPGPKGPKLFDIYDLIARPKGERLCKACSKQTQRIVRHQGEGCPLMIQDKFSYQDKAAQPDFNTQARPGKDRISGQQMTRKAKKAAKQGTGKFPCRYTDCVYGYYSARGHANKHMKQKHGLQDGDERLYPPAPAVEKEKKSSTQTPALTSSSSSPASSTTTLSTTSSTTVSTTASTTASTTTTTTATPTTTTTSSTNVATTTTGSTRTITTTTSCTATTTTTTTTTEYEQRRAMNISENNKKIAELGLLSLGISAQGPAPPPPPPIHCAHTNTSHTVCARRTGDSFAQREAGKAEASGNCRTNTGVIKTIPKATPCVH